MEEFLNENINNKKEVEELIEQEGQHLGEYYRDKLLETEGDSERIKELFGGMVKLKDCKIAKLILDKFGRDIDFTEQVKQGFIKNLEKGDFSKAIRIKEELGEGIDFTEQVKQGFINNLEDDYFYKAIRIKENLGEGIDFTEIEGYADFCTQGFINNLKEGDVYKAIRIKEKLGEGIDFTEIEGYADACKQGFINNLKDDYFYTAIEIKEKLGEGIDFTEIEGYVDACKQGFIKKLEEGHVSTAIEIKEKLGEGIDFTECFTEVEQEWTIDNIPLKELESLNNMYKGDVNYLMIYIRDINNKLLPDGVSYKNDISPIIKSQGPGAVYYFKSVSGLAEEVSEFDRNNFDQVKDIAKRKGILGRNVLENLYIPIFKEGGFSDKEFKSIFIPYLQDIQIASVEIYNRYKEIYDNNRGDARNEKLEELKQFIQRMRTKVYEGKELSDNEDISPEIYTAIQMEVFSPAIGITQKEMEKLNADRPDRQQDVETKFGGKENLDKFEQEHGLFSLGIGKYEIGEGEELDLKDWDELSSIIKNVNKEDRKIKSNGETMTEDLKVNGLKILGYFKNGQNEEDRQKLWTMMYKHEVISGRSLPENYTANIEGLMAYKEFIGDRIKSDYIKKMLEAVQDTPEYSEIRNDIEKRIKIRNPKAIAKKITEMLKVVSEDETKQDSVSKAVWKMGMLNLEEIKAVLSLKKEGESDEKVLEKYIQERAERGSDNIDNIVVEMVGRNLVYKDNVRMRKEIDKFEFRGESTIQESQINLEFKISKRRAHGVAGYNMGICVTPDKKLWSDPEFMNVICFDKDKKVALGGMHLLWREYEGKTYLVLPGINPNMEILGKVKAEELYEKYIEFAQAVAKETEADGLWIPQNHIIHSNRTQIQSVISNKKYKEKVLDESLAFSYDPYSYSVDSVFIVN